MEPSTWDEIQSTIATAPYPVRPLPAEPDRAQAVLATLGISASSWLGAVVANSGALLIDHGWLRVLGSGGHGLPDVAAATDASTGRLIVAYDVLGGQFAWMPHEPGASPTLHYFGPDTLEWLDLRRGYGEWLDATISGALTGFYETLRWPGWESDVAALPPDQGIGLFPPPWSQEGQDLSSVSRRAMPLLQLAAAYHETARQLDAGE